MKLLLIIVICLSVSWALSSNEEKKSQGYRRAFIKRLENISKEYKNEFKNFLKTNKKSERHEFLKTLMTPSIQAASADIVPASADVNIKCTICWSAASVFLDFRRNEKKPDSFMAEIAYNLCTDLGLAAPNVCRGLIDKHLEIVMYIIDTNKDLSEALACDLYLQSSNCGGTSLDWSIEIDQTGPGSRLVNESKKLIHSKGLNDLKILHITDVHVDFNYTVGASTQCSEPICCRASQSEDLSLVSPEFAAGRWGEYDDCDTPFEVYEDALKTIQSTQKNLDYVYHTGDSIVHGVWETTIEANRYALHTIDQVLKETLAGVTVFPTVGNHESDPVNVFAPESVRKDRPDLSTQWLYEYLADEWSTWLPESALETVRKGGYYTVTPRKGFRVIALNNNDCYTENFWLLLDYKFPAIQLQWLHDTLLQAEKDGEFVHIIAHMPTGSGNYLYSCARAFRQLVERFHNIIGGIFLGHAHHDEFNIYYSTENPDLALNVAWNAGGLTPGSNINPNYRIYSVEAETYQVVSHETYMYNITEANLTPEKTPNWYQSYSFAQEYGIDNLSPASLDELVYKFANDKNLLHKYWEHKYKHGDTTLAKGCNDECLQNNLCAIVLTYAEDKRKCNDLLAIYQKNA